MPQRISRRLLAIVASRMMRREETKQIAQHVVELIDLQRCRLFRHKKQGHVGGEGIRKHHLQADGPIELLPVESTDRARRHFEHPMLWPVAYCVGVIAQVYGPVSYPIASNTESYSVK